MHPSFFQVSVDGRWCFATTKLLPLLVLLSIELIFFYRRSRNVRHRVSANFRLATDKNVLLTKKTTVQVWWITRPLSGLNLLKFSMFQTNFRQW